MRTNDSRRREYARRKRLFEQLRLQADVLCDSNEDHKQTVVLGRMMNIILDIVGHRSLNDVTRQALANHFSDSAYDKSLDPTVKLGGSGERNMLHLDGLFDITDLAKRIIWTDTRASRVIEGVQEKRC
jgi:hypothetical protein